jgi:two-component system chemotaxis response regulator CheB
MERDSRTIVVVGASAGGVQALRELVAELPAQCDASILVVLHTGAGKSLLPNVLTRAGVMEATHAIQGEPLLPGHIYIAPPDHHMLIEGSHIQLTQGPRENHSRPAIDPLFRSAARAYGAQVVGVVLSGALSDGTSGLSMIKELGGITIVQDPQDAIVEGMPTSALRVLEPDYVLPAFEIGRLLRRLVMRPVVGLTVSSMAPDEAVGHGTTGYFQEQPDDQHF